MINQVWFTVGCTKQSTIGMENVTVWNRKSSISKNLATCAIRYIVKGYLTINLLLFVMSPSLLVATIVTIVARVTAQKFPVKMPMSLMFARGTISFSALAPELLELSQSWPASLFC